MRQANGHAYFIGGAADDVRHHLVGDARCGGLDRVWPNLLCHDRLHVTKYGGLHGRSVGSQVVAHEGAQAS